MNRRANLVFLFAIAVLVSGCGQQKNVLATSSSDLAGSKNQLVGTWKLVSRVVTSEAGAVIQDPTLGATPTGYLMYDSTGHVTAQFMRADRPAAVDCSTSTTSPAEDNSQSVNGYDAYFGKYTIDETNHTVTYHLEGALATGDVGKNLIRHFEVSGDKLTVDLLSPKEKQIRTLILERVH